MTEKKPEEEFEYTEEDLKGAIKFVQFRRQRKEEARKAYEEDFQPGCVEATPWFWKILLGSIVLAIAFSFIGGWQEEDEDSKRISDYLTASVGITDIQKIS